MNLRDKFKAARATSPPATPLVLTREEMREVGIESEAVPSEAAYLNGHAKSEEPSPTKAPRRDSYLPEVQRALPQSLDAEKGVLGSILLSAKKVMYQVEGTVGASHFYDPANRTIYGALKQLHSDNEPIDLISVTQYLQDQGKLEEVGGAGYLTDLFCFVPTSSNVGYYLMLLVEKFRARELLLACTKAASEAYNPAADTSLVLDGLEETVRALRNMGGRNGRLPDLDDMINITGDNRPPPPPELVKGLLHQGSKIIIGGTSKGRKTFALMDLAISVATGTQWWGCDTIKGKVCYINFEIQKPFFAKRYEDICRKKDATPEPGMFMSWTLRGMVEGMEKMADQLIKSLISYDFSLIIVDPIYKALGDRDENKAGDVASLLNELERIAVRTGAAIAFGAHYSKGNQAAKESIDRIGGSGVFARDPDAILAMTPHEEEECFTVEATLRNFAPKEPFVLRWEWPLFHVEEILNPADLKKPKTAQRGQSTGQSTGQFEQKFSDDELYAIIEKLPNGRKPNEIMKLALEQIGMKDRTFWNLWKKLKASQRVLERDRFWYANTPSNQEKVYAKK